VKDELAVNRVSENWRQDDAILRLQTGSQVYGKASRREVEN
jgi:hypothetical protein